METIEKLRARQSFGGLVARSTATLLAIGFVVLLGIVVTTYVLAEGSRASFDEVITARDTRTAAVDLRNALLTAESSQRGFVFNGNEIYLAPFDTAKSLSLRRLERLKRMLASDPSVAPTVDRLQSIIVEKFAEMDQTIALKRQRRDDEVTAILSTNRGKTLTDEANVFFTGIILAADDRLTANVAAQRSNSVWLRWITIAGGIAIVIVIGFAMEAILRSARQLAASQKILEETNAGLEERVKDRTADLVRANEEVQRFAYIVTHDLRAPLVNIMGFTSELETGVASLQALIEKTGIASDTAEPLAASARIAVEEDLPEAIRFIRSSTRKMDGLINAILQLSREGRRSLRSETVNLSNLIEAGVAAVRHQLTEAGGQVDLELEIDHLETDHLALEQVFANILDNAIKYRSKERALTIHINAKRGGDRVVFEITDNGRGIASQDLERVFELFRRSGPQDQAGEGIGLAHVRAVVRRLGGDITVSSTLDLSTTFRIELPLRVDFVESTST